MRRFGVLYQSGARWSSMTLAENVALPLGEYTTLSPRKMRDVVSLKLALVGLADCIEVTHFDGNAGGEVVLVARWRLGGADGKELVIRKSRFTTAASARDYAATVTAMSRTLEALSREITTTILTIAPTASAR